MSCTPYLSKHTLFYHVFCCTSLKLWHLPILFSLFQNFGFLSCYNGMGADGGGGEVEGLTLYLRNCTSYDCGFWYTCVKWWYPQQYFFSFFQNSDFSGFSKFINKCRKEILRLRHLLHMYVIFFCIFIQPFQKFHMQYYVACQLAR